MTQPTSSELEAQAKRLRTVFWVIGLATVGLIFDGYDLVVYGAVVSTFLRDPSHIGVVTPATAGVLGSYALVGVLFGALLAGTVGDILGRRKVMLASYAWFSVGMALTAMATTTTAFGWLRFFTGLGIGALVATTAALVAEYAPKDKKNLCNAISNGGIPLGSLLSAVLAMVLMEHIGWRGMFWIGALPIVTLLPLAYFKMPESVAWLAARGRMDEARALSERTGVPLPAAPVANTTTATTSSGAPDAHKTGFAGLFSRYYLFATLVLGLMSATGLVLVYSLNTWLPELLTLGLPLGGLLAVVAIVGLGTSGTQTLIYGFTANYYRTNVRAAGVAWCAGFGRLGGIAGPMLGSFLIGANLALDSIFYVLAGIGVVGIVLTLLVPMSHSSYEGPSSLKRVR